MEPSIDGQHAWLGCEVFSAAKTKPRAPNAALAFLRCARYRVPARPRARAPRSAGPRGALRRLRRLGWRPRRPGARQPRHESVAGRARARGSRPRARARAARPAPRVQRPRRRAPMRRRPSRAPAAGAQVGVFFARTAQPSGRVRTN